MIMTFSKLHIDIPHHSYSIYTGIDILSMLGPVAQEYKIPQRVVIVGDKITVDLYGEQIKNSFANFGFVPSLITLQIGEGEKTLETVRAIYDKLFELRISRDSALVAVGGGVVGDITGFVAATYLRGLPYIQVPTTLLAQIDSSVGGKVGVNLPYGKNLVGAFYQPVFVFIDVKTLQTLPSREIRSGFAEVIKYGAILDEELFTHIESSIDRLMKPDLEYYPEIIQRCCSLKASIVSKDETESGTREILNFGHTIGHALETLSEYQTFTHGEAVTYGMIAEARLSVLREMIRQNDAERLIILLEKLNPPRIDNTIDKNIIFEKLYADKKVRSGKLRFTLLAGLGNALYGIMPEEDMIRQVLRELLEKYRTQ